ncbi:FHA domain-containing protein [Botrimarina sp.]|uniref:FHA domain-containing protein n=1 Tax=Botrimarina sp. TaxID=2795802 RepID=UPI0032EE2F80
MKLTVLAGAKAGTAVPIKKSSFIIGRSKECALRAGSEAISRKHCELKVTDSGVTVEDLGSRNGTYVNDEKVEGAYTLSNGDRLRIGPLEFRYDAEGELKKAKAPKIADAAEAVQRKASSSADQDNFEASISDWLLSPPEPAGRAPNLGETMSMRTDETRQVVDDTADTAEVQDAGDGEPADGEPSETADDDGTPDKKGKKKPGKLPFRPSAPQAKDSREAAEQVLREMSRRR